MIPGSLEALLLDLIQRTEEDIDVIEVHVEFLLFMAQHGVSAQSVTLIILKREELKIFEKKKIGEAPIIDVKALIAEERAAKKAAWYNPKTVGRPCVRPKGVRRH